MISNILSGWFRQFEGEWPRLYLVGGAVRDLLISKPPKDMDLVCKGAEFFARRLAGSRDAALVPMEKKPNQPCYRVVDRNSPQNSLDIAEMAGENIQEDLGRRDFTINAMAMEIKPEGGPGPLIDPYGGANDLKDGLIRATSKDVFHSDPLRILRAVRFAAKLRFEIEPSTLDSMEHYGPLLSQVSPERISEELFSILSMRQSLPSFLLMDRIGVLDILFPEIMAMKRCTQDHYHDSDVWQHSLSVMAHCETILNNLPDFFGSASSRIDETLGLNNRIPLLKLAALFHDVGKPDSQAFHEEKGRITFYGHAESGARIMDGIAVRLRMSNRNRDFLCNIVSEHMHLLHLADPRAKAKARMRLFRKMKDDVVPLIILGMADVQGTTGPASSRERAKAHLAWSRKTLNEYLDVVKKRLEQKSLVTGKDLMALGMEPGPAMGRILKRLGQAQDGGEIEDREEALFLAKQWLSMEGTAT